MFLLYLSQSPKCKYAHRCVTLQPLFLFNLHPISEFPLPPFPKLFENSLTKKHKAKDC